MVGELIIYGELGACAYITEKCSHSHAINIVVPPELVGPFFEARKDGRVAKRCNVEYRMRLTIQASQRPVAFLLLARLGRGKLAPPRIELIKPSNHGHRIASSLAYWEIRGVVQPMYRVVICSVGIVYGMCVESVRIVYVQSNYTM